MDIKKLINDDDAVSPVIGVILMVAITVILAAVIASFVLGLGDQAQQTTPQASFSFDYTQDDAGDDTLKVTHDGGDTIEAARINATASGAIAHDYSGGSETDLKFGTHPGGADGELFTSEVSAGTTDTLNGDDFHDGADYASSMTGDHLDLSETTIRVVYSDASGDSSSTLATWEGPDA
ncbi:flagellin N-terminal-like domain-containing protein [Halomicrobium zhouii]|uniref:Flagellin N-terminal-like domain-containing protein n=1 Tax=Halomicrobium zhouii TaxID=767519 RepID=A0A1I6L9A2_9EURY|nr:type IV pilin N-terminal domain-containing protein [Halomicrobium zhouii]SFR99984.1 flagellin N-terminal-like domain-containing protein [Halomicrobium zhouii]